MKVFVLSAVHPEYPKQFYKKHPGLERKTFQEQKSALDYDAHSWADFWSHGLRPHGFGVAEVNVNVRPLQKAWTVENGVPFKRDTWIRDVASHQLRHFQPDVLFLADFSHFDLGWLQEVKRQCPAVRLTLAWYGSYYPDLQIFKTADAVLSCIPELVEECKAQGLKSYHLNHAFEPRILDRLKRNGGPSIDFSFIGQIARGKGLHNQRLKILNAIVKHCDINIYTPGKSGLEKLKSEGEQYVYGFAQNLKAAGVSNAVLKEIPIIRKAANWTEPPDHTRHVKPYLNSAVFGLEMFQTLKDSTVTLNQHIDISARSASNMRLFEATGVGTCLLTDWKENLHALFEPEKEVVTYRSVEECVEKVRWLLDHPAEREKIRNAGQDHTLNEHTFTQRAAVLSELIRKLMK